MGQNSDFVKDLEDYFKNTPREKVLEDWAKSKEFDNINSPLMIDYIQFIEKTKTPNLIEIKKNLDQLKRN